MDKHKNLTFFQFLKIYQNLLNVKMDKMFMDNFHNHILSFCIQVDENKFQTKNEQNDNLVDFYKFLFSDQCFNINDFHMEI